MTSKFVLPLLIFGAVAGMSVSMNAAPVTPPHEAFASGSVVLAQTPGMERRWDRRAARQDCRVQNGLIGQAKRDCKQDAMQQRY